MYKQIIIARKDLNMSSGKLAAQVAHGASCFLCKTIQDSVSKVIHDHHLYELEGYIDKGVYDEWIGNTFTKIVLEAKNKNHLLKAKTIAEELGLVEGEDFFLIRDCCRTELEPEEEDGTTLTVIGFRPLDEETADRIGKKYQLWKE